MDPLSTTETTVTYNGDGTTRDFTFAFPYLDPSHIFAFVDDVPVTYTRIAQQVIRVTVPPATGSILAIERHTPSDPYVVFRDGTVILSEDLTASEAQARFIAEEARDLAKRGLRFNDALQAYDAKGFRISNVADPVLGADAMNKRSVDQLIIGLIGGDLLADYLAQAQALADQVNADRVYIEGQVPNFAAGVDTAQDLADAVAAGPTGAVIAQRITEYLGSDDWIQGGTGGPTAVEGPHRYWRLANFTMPASESYICELEFREEVGVPETASGGSFTTTGSAAFVAKLFNGETSSGNYATVHPADTVGWDFTTPKTVMQVALNAPVYFDAHTYMPTAFDVQYSDDGSAWTTALSVSGSAGWVAGETRTFDLPVLVNENVQTFDASGTWTKPGKGKMVHIQAWGAGGGNNGGGGQFAELYLAFHECPNSLAITVPGATSGNGGNAIVGSVLTALGGQANGGRGGGPDLGEGSGDPGKGGVFHGGGGGSPTVAGGSSVYGGGGGSALANGLSQFAGRGGGPSGAAQAPAGGGGPGVAGAHGRVRIFVW